MSLAEESRESPSWLIESVALSPSSLDASKRLFALHLLSLSEATPRRHSLGAAHIKPL